MRFLVLSASFCVFFLCGGCGGTGQVEVEGAVTIDGQPIEGGAIAFMAMENQGLNGGGTILKGKYHIPENVGPKTGKYKVEIRWAKPTGEKFKSEDTGAILEKTSEGLPGKFNDQTELTVDLVRGKNTCNFDLKKQGSSGSIAACKFAYRPKRQSSVKQAIIK